MDKEEFKLLKEELISSQFIINRKNLFGLDLPKTQVKCLKYNLIPIIIGNDKIGDDTICINMSSSFNCYSAKMGYCEHCNGSVNHSCYARNLEDPFKNTLSQNLICGFLFDELTVDELIYQLSEAIIQNNIKFIRYNTFGDFKSQKQFNKANKISKALFDKFGVISYSYTHNKDLKISVIENSYIVMNYSYKTGLKGVKQAITAFKFETKYLDDSKYVICNGDCFKCPYCKDKNDKRTIVFMAHGKGFDGLDMLPEGLLGVLEDIKARDWALFNSKLVNPNNLTLNDFL